MLEVALVVAVNADSASCVSPDVDAVQFAPWPEALGVTYWPTTGARPRSVAGKATVPARTRALRTARSRPLAPTEAALTPGPAVALEP